MDREPLIPTNHRTDILKVIRDLYVRCAFSVGETGSITPLYKLIEESYPICVAEIRKLTTKRATEFLANRTGRTISCKIQEDRPLAGFLYVCEYGKQLMGYILVKQEDPVVRRRFSAAHELGHYLLHFLPLWAGGELSMPLLAVEGLLEGSEEEADSTELQGEVSMLDESLTTILLTPEIHQRMEDEANLFAAELLMPEVVCRAIVRRHQRLRGIQPRFWTRYLAAELLVSQQAIQRRLKDLQLIEK